MSDTFDAATRSKIMGKVRPKNTGPELIVRRTLHHMGYRFRLHVPSLPGTPDIVLPRYRKIVLVHGCFWHSHAGCARATRPQSHRRFWKQKLDGNRRRDRATLRQLTAEGWDVLVVWQCETADQQELGQRLAGFLGPRSGATHV